MLARQKVELVTARNLFEVIVRRHAAEGREAQVIVKLEAGADKLTLVVAGVIYLNGNVGVVGFDVNDEVEGLSLEFRVADSEVGTQSVAHVPVQSRAHRCVFVGVGFFAKIGVVDVTVVVHVAASQPVFH